MIKPRKSVKAPEVKDPDLERRIEDFASKADLVRVSNQKTTKCSIRTPHVILNLFVLVSMNTSTRYLMR